MLLCSDMGLAAEAPDAGGLSAVTANSMVEQCFARSRANNWPPFSIAIVDPSGSLLVFRRQDGASGITVDAAMLKARTSVRAGTPTGALATLSRQDAAVRDLLLLLQLTADPGGIPLKRAGHLVAAIGVSGGSAEQDIGCANLIAAAAGD